MSITLTGLGRIAGREKEYSKAHQYLNEALELSRTLEDLWSGATALYLLGEVEYFQGNIEQSANFFIESLKMNQIVGDKAMISFTVHHLGKVASQLGDIKRAAVLFGSAKKLRANVTETTWSLSTQADCDKDIDSLRSTMKSEEFESAWEEGQAMSGDEAIGYSLK